MDSKIYKYGTQYYSFEEMYQLYKSTSYDMRKKMKDCMCHFILAEILKKGGLYKYGEDLDNVALFESQHMESHLSKRQQVIYQLKIAKLMGFAEFKNKYKASELVNGEWVLNKLVSLTIGSSYPKDEQDDFSLINYNDMSEEECTAVADNFLKNIWNEELVQYRFPKKLGKSRNIND